MTVPVPRTRGAPSFHFTMYAVLPASDRFVPAVIVTCWLAAATTGEYATVMPATLPLGDGATVLGVPEGVADGDADDDGVLVADAEADGDADAVADGLVEAVSVGVALSDVGVAEDGDALSVLLGLALADALDVSLGAGVVVLGVLDPLEHAASTSGRATRASVRPGRRVSLVEAEATRRLSFNGMGFSWLRRPCRTANVRRPPSREV